MTKYTIQAATLLVAMLLLAATSLCVNPVQEAHRQRMERQLNSDDYDTKQKIIECGCPILSLLCHTDIGLSKCMAKTTIYRLLVILLL